MLAIQRGNYSPSPVPFSEVNFALLREAGIIGSPSIFGRGGLEMGTEKLCVQAVPDIPY